MQTYLDELRAEGADVLVVSFTGPKQVTAYLKRYPLPFPVVSDPTRAAYRAFTLASASWPSLFRPRVLLPFIKLLLRGWEFRKPARGDDLLQLGGDFLLNPRGRLAWAYPSENPTDRPGKDAVLHAVRAAVS